MGLFASGANPPVPSLWLLQKEKQTLRARCLALWLLQKEKQCLALWSQCKDFCLVALNTTLSACRESLATSVENRSRHRDLRSWAALGGSVCAGPVGTCYQVRGRGLPHENKLDKSGPGEDDLSEVGLSGPDRNCLSTHLIVPACHVGCCSRPRRSASSGDCVGAYLDLIDQEE